MKLNCTKHHMVMFWFDHWEVQACVTLTVNCTLRSCHFVTWAFMICSIGSSLLIINGSQNSFSDTSCGGRNIHLVRIQLGLHSKSWEVRLCGWSAVHGWAGVAGHLTESLSRICLLRFLLSSSSVFDRAQICRSYCTIWKHRSRHTTQSILSELRFLIDQG